MDVKQIFPENGNMGRILPDYLSQWTTDKVRVEGVEVLPNSSVHSAVMEGDQLYLTLEDGTRVECFFNHVGTKLFLRLYFLYR